MRQTMVQHLHDLTIRHFVRSNFLGFRGQAGGAQSSTESARVRIGLLGASQVMTWQLDKGAPRHTPSTYIYPDVNHRTYLKVSTYAVVWPSRRLPSCEVVAVAARDGKRAEDFARWHR